MSRGGRGGARAAATAGIRAVANALGIQRSEMGTFTRIVSDAPPLYPPIDRPCLPVEKSDELQYVAELRQEIVTRFHESPFYLEPLEKEKGIKRYTDKYRVFDKEILKPDWLRIPQELYWGKTQKGEMPQKKKRKMIAYDSSEAEAKLAKLEEHEAADGKEPEALAEEVEDEQSESEKEENNENDEQEALSDDDYQEEDNDYVHSYFDNGENYGDVGSDDNLDDDAAF